MITPIQPASGQWNYRQEGGAPIPTPYVTVSGIAYDHLGNFPLIFRGPNVRSAKNCWSLPSGMHECGYRVEEQFAIELKEELNLEADPTKADLIGVYENIAVVDNWHWVIVLITIPIETLDTIVNKEPDRHPEIRICNYQNIDQALTDLVWAPSLKGALERYRKPISWSVFNALIRSKIMPEIV